MTYGELGRSDPRSNIFQMAAPQNILQTNIYMLLLTDRNSYMSCHVASLYLTHGNLERLNSVMHISNGYISENVADEHMILLS